MQLSINDESPKPARRRLRVRFTEPVIFPVEIGPVEALRKFTRFSQPSQIRIIGVGQFSLISATLPGRW